MLREPVICRDGHTTCNVCLEKALSGRSFPICPVDRRYLGTAKPVRNLTLQSLIMGFEIRCPNGSGCKWTAKLETLQSHQKKCAMEMVRCTNTHCAALVYRFEMGSHRDQCPHRWNLVFIVKRENAADMVLHLRTCPKVSISCPNNCGVNILRYFYL